MGAAQSEPAFIMIGRYRTALEDLAKGDRANPMTGHDPRFAYQTSNRVGRLVGGHLEQGGLCGIAFRLSH